MTNDFVAYTSEPKFKSSLERKKNGAFAAYTAPEPEKFDSRSSTRHLVCLVWSLEGLERAHSLGGVCND